MQDIFLLTPLREGRLKAAFQQREYFFHFYSRPCGRGDFIPVNYHYTAKISTHAPAGGATETLSLPCFIRSTFLLTPLREGRQIR